MLQKQPNWPEMADLRDHKLNRLGTCMARWDKVLSAGPIRLKYYLVS